jgi:hypothetical protein
MTGHPDFHELLRDLAQQQSALSQQQTALLQLQSESLRLQRLLIERAMGEVPPAVQQPIVITPSTDQAGQEPADEPPADEHEIPIATVHDQPHELPASPSEVEPPPGDSPVEESPRVEAASNNDAPRAASVQPVFVPGSRAARYMQPTSAKPVRAVTRHDVDRVTRLYETGEVAHLVLNFGEYRGATLLQVAQTDPEYVRQLALTAQRPQVRAAARQLVIALEEVAAHTPRTARSATRRTRPAG